MWPDRNVTLRHICTWRQMWNSRSDTHDPTGAWCSKTRDIRQAKGSTHTWHQTCDARRHMWRQTCHACVALGNIMLRFIEYQNAKKNYFFLPHELARLQHEQEFNIESKAQENHLLTNWMGYMSQLQSTLSKSNALGWRNDVMWK